MTGFQALSLLLHTLLCNDLEFKLSQYFTKLDKIAEVDPHVPSFHSAKLFLR